MYQSVWTGFMKTFLYIHIVGSMADGVPAQQRKVQPFQSDIFD